MRRILLIFFTISCLSLQLSAQTMTTENGLSTVVFDTKYAIVSVYLPDDLQHGDKIFGTYNVYTAGITDEQLEYSLAQVRKYKFNFSNPDNHTNVMQTMINITPNHLINLLPLKITSSLILSLTETYNKVYKQEIKPVSAPVIPVDGCLSPEHFLLGKPLRITGTFDGNGANTRVSIGNVNFQVMAESPRQCIVEVPEKMVLTDTMEIKVMEDFKPKCTQAVYPVKMTVGYDKIKVKKGETATIFITIKGLQHFGSSVKLTIENTTPEIVSMKNGNKQVIEITPEQVNGAKEYKLNFTVQGITSGDFFVETDLKIPEDFPDVIER